MLTIFSWCMGRTSFVLELLYFPLKEKSDRTVSEQFFYNRFQSITRGRNWFFCAAMFVFFCKEIFDWQKIKKYDTMSRERQNVLFCTVKPVSNKPKCSTKPVNSNMSFGTKFVCPCDIFLNSSSLQISLRFLRSQCYTYKCATRFFLVCVCVCVCVCVRVCVCFVFVVVVFFFNW
jgi:hypothetical protein